MEQNIRILDGDRIILKKNKNKLDEQMSAAFLEVTLIQNIYLFLLLVQ